MKKERRRTRNSAICLKSCFAEWCLNRSVERERLKLNVIARSTCSSLEQEQITTNTCCIGVRWLGFERKSWVLGACTTLPLLQVAHQLDTRHSMLTSPWAKRGVNNMIRKACMSRKSQSHSSVFQRRLIILRIDLFEWNYGQPVMR